MSRFGPFLVSLLLVSFLFSTGALAAKVSLLVFHPASLETALAKIERAFEKVYPEVDVRRQVIDSWAALRSVSKGKARPDVVISADAYFLRDFYRPYLRDGVVVFARDTMVVAATDQLRADVLAAGNWVETLASPRTKWGLSDPFYSLAGYQALISMILWSMEHGFHSLCLVKDFLHKTLGIKVICCKPTGWELKLPSKLSPKGGHLYMGREVQLLAMLRAQEIYYLFLYKSQALRWRLRFYQPPDTQNLGKDSLAVRYQQVKLIFPGGQVLRGEPILYGVALLKRGPHPRLAERFRTFLLSEEGRALLEESHLPWISPFKL